MSVTKRPARSALGELALLQREINQLFERLTTWSAADEPVAGEWCPPVDVFESKGGWIVVVEVPGLPAEALQVSLRDGRLVVSGERRAHRRPAESPAFLCIERPLGRFRRTVPIDAAVDVEHARARLRDGLLTVSLPRLKDRRRRETVIAVTEEPA